MVRGLDEGFLGVLGVPEIAFEIDDAGGRDLRGVDIGRRQILRGAEIGVHGALAVRRHQDVGAAGGGAVRCRLGFERDAGGADVVGVEPADLVIPDLADIGGARAEIGDADNGVGGRAAGHLGGRAHVAVDRGGARLVDQRHAALGHAVVGQESLVGLRQDVENRIADRRARRISLQPFNWSCFGVGKGCGLSRIGPAPASGAAISAFMIRSFLTVSSGTLASRLLGFVRDAMLAALLGAGPVADAFLVAFQLVNVVRRLLTEGALNAALVPAWLRIRETEARPQPRPLPAACSAPSASR